MLRSLRSQRRDLDRQLKELSALKVYADNNITKVVDAPSTSKSNNTPVGKKTREAKETKNDELLLTEPDRDKHKRLTTILSKEQEKIEARTFELKQLLEEDDTLLTDSEKNKRSISICAKFKMFNQTLKTFQNHTEAMLKICQGTDVDKYYESQDQILEASHEIAALYEAKE